MAKNPRLQLDAEEWRAKLQEHPLEIEGAMIRFRSKAWINGNKLELSLTSEQWARLWGVDLENAGRLIAYILGEGLALSPCVTADGSVCNARVTLAVEIITPEHSEKAERKKEQTRLRVQRLRERQRGEAPKESLPVTDGVTPPKPPGQISLVSSGNATLPNKETTT